MELSKITNISEMDGCMDGWIMIVFQISDLYPSMFLSIEIVFLNVFFKANTTVAIYLNVKHAKERIQQTTYTRFAQQFCSK